MITSVDTNVLLDVLTPGSAHSDESDAALASAVGEGAVVISELVYAELSSYFPTKQALDVFLSETGIRLERSSPDVLHEAGRAWRGYTQRRPASLGCPACGATQNVRCERCGTRIRPRQHVLPDFMIGAHAVARSDRLLTRDRGYYATYFPDLTLGFN